MPARFLFRRLVELLIGLIFVLLGESGITKGWLLKKLMELVGLKELIDKMPDLFSGDPGRFILVAVGMTGLLSHIYLRVGRHVLGKRKKEIDELQSGQLCNVNEIATLKLQLDSKKREQVIRNRLAFFSNMGLTDILKDEKESVKDERGFELWKTQHRAWLTMVINYLNDCALEADALRFATPTLPKIEVLPNSFNKHHELLRGLVIVRVKILEKIIDRLAD